MVCFYCRYSPNSRTGCIRETSKKKSKKVEVPTWVWRCNFTNERKTSTVPERSVVFARFSDSLVRIFYRMPFVLIDWLRLLATIRSCSSSSVTRVFAFCRPAVDVLPSVGALWTVCWPSVDHVDRLLTVDRLSSACIWLLSNSICLLWHGQTRYISGWKAIPFS
jgi:hypothetical protein